MAEGLTAVPQTERRRRPLSRLARRTALPPRVAIRARNPWVLARLRVLGWYVRFTSGRPFVVPDGAMPSPGGAAASPEDRRLSRGVRCP